MTAYLLLSQPTYVTTIHRMASSRCQRCHRNSPANDLNGGILLCQILLATDALIGRCQFIFLQINVLEVRDTINCHDRIFAAVKV
jgi:hypothetical protein